MSEEEVLVRLRVQNPKLICFVVYGNNVNAGTANMSGAVELADFLKKNEIQNKIAFMGSHVQALPIETLKNEKSIDFVFTNEGVYALRNILKLQDLSANNLKNVKGIAYRDKDNIKMNASEKVVPNEKNGL